jgi:hypothetical protein
MFADWLALSVGVGYRDGAAKNACTYSLKAFYVASRIPLSIRTVVYNS